MNISLKKTAVAILATLVLTSCQDLPFRTERGSSPGSQETKSKSRDQAINDLFEILDVNGDGIVTKEEARAGFQYLIASYDRPKNEVLAVKPGASTGSGASKKKKHPTPKDADRAFSSLFTNDGKNLESVNRDEFKKLVVKAGTRSDGDPFEQFYE